MRCSQSSSISIASVLLFFLVACHCALLPSQPHPGEVSLKRGQRHSLPSNHPAYAAHRVIPRISDLTLIHFDHSNTISINSPIGTAAQILAHFYTQISLGAEGPWAHNEPRTWIRMTLGSLQLLMSATEGYTVPWSFVSWHAVQMLQYVQSGYVSTYDAYYVTPHGEAGVIVSLTCQAIGSLTSAAAIAAAGAHGDGGLSLDPNAKAFNPPS